MTRVIRAVLVVMGLNVAGAILGALAAGGAVATSLLIRGALDAYRYEDVVVAARLGGLLGAVLGPACAFVFLRRVPLWAALGVPTLGTYVAGVLGGFTSAGFITAPAGFVIALVILHGRGESITDQAAS